MLQAVVRHRGWLQYVVAQVEALDLLRAVTLPTLFLVIRFGFHDWQMQMAASMSLLVVLFFPAALYSVSLWALLAVASSAALVVNWETADNHKYLFVYWMWIMTAVMAVREIDWREQIILFNARFFLVFIFLAAALQKFLSPTYMSGEMFELVMLTDRRFYGFGDLLGTSREVVEQTGQQLARLRAPTAEVVGNEIIMPSNDRVRTLALLITWYDLYVQVLIGALFVVRRRITDLAAHLLLLFFIFTTYLAAPVGGFGWLLAIFGFALTKETAPRLHIVYFASFFALLIYGIPWRTWVLSVF